MGGVVGCRVTFVYVICIRAKTITGQIYTYWVGIRILKTGFKKKKRVHINMYIDKYVKRNVFLFRI